MQEYSLTIGAIARHGTTVHTRRQVRTRRPDGTMRVATFAQLGERTAQLANALRALGAGTDTVVATFMWNNQEHVEAYCAVPAMGAVLHTLNIRLATEQLVYIANHAGDEIAIVDASLAGQFSEIAPHVPTLHTIIVTGDTDLSCLIRTGKRVVRYDDILDGQPTMYDWPDIDERNAAAMCYTSGTTGNPKGVVYSHRSTYLHTMAICAKGALEVGPEDSVLPIVPMFHANAWGLIYAALMAGADLVLPDRFLQAEPLVELIERERPTIAGAVPTVWNDVVQYLEERPDADISSLRLVGCGGSAVPVHLMRTLHDKYGIYLVQAWGMTETSPLATISKPAPILDDSQYWQRRASQGRPACGVEVRIVDSDGTVVGHDGEAVGEIQVRGPWITGGYLDLEADNSFDSGWLSTGDIGSIDADGYVTLTDRAKDVIKSGGEWISSVQLELAIASHPDVFEAAVIAVPDDRWQERPLAAVVLGHAADVTIAELQDFLRDKVARWWIPERWAFVDQLPRTSTGKCDKKCLREWHSRGQLTPADLTGR
ncbi:fatty acid--CoA ligase [Mycobacterium aquaticum]|nr:fatty acid--CoA ligase [Mycobacterium aquaticum]